MFRLAITSSHPRHTRSKRTKPPTVVSTNNIGVKWLISKSNDDAQDNDINEYDVLVSTSTEALELNTNNIPRITELSGLIMEGVVTTRLNTGGDLEACCPPSRRPTSWY